jgi:hypothetical protein
MKKKIVGILICMLVIATVLVPMVGSKTINLTNPGYKPLSQEDQVAFSKRGDDIDNWGITDSIDLREATSITLIFIQIYDIMPVGGNDYGYLKISDNGGSSWTTIKEYQGKLFDWQEEIINIDSFAGDNILIGFELKTSSDSLSQGWWIDRIVIDADDVIIYNEDFEGYSPGDDWEDWVVTIRFNPENTEPEPPVIEGPNTGKQNKPLIYHFQAYDVDYNNISYYIDWGDETATDWTEFQPAGSVAYSESHTWTETGTYTIRAKARDDYLEESDWSEYSVRITKSRDRHTSSLLLLRFLERIFEKLQISLPLFD